MSNLPVVWSEGMFISPQHFQQQDRAMQYFVAMISSFDRRDNDFGLAQLEIDDAQLKIGKFGIKNAVGLFPDQTPFVMTRQVTLDIPADTVNKIVSLALPLAMQGHRDIGEEGENRRFVRSRLDLDDINDEQNIPLEAELASLNPRLILQGADTAGFALIEVARIQEVKGGGEVVLDRDFFPNAICLSGCGPLINRTNDLLAFVKLRINNASQRLLAAQSDQSNASLLTEMHELRALNAWTLQISQALHTQSARPRDIFHLLGTLEAELASVDGRAMDDYQPYDESRRQELFVHQYDRLNSRISLSQPSNVVRLEWDSSLFEKRRLLQLDVSGQQILPRQRPILAIRSNMPNIELSVLFPRAAKMVSVSSIVDIVMHGLPGIPLEYMRVPPSELRSQADISYFRIDTNHPYWEEFLKSGKQLAMHIDDRVTSASATLYILD